MLGSASCRKRAPAAGRTPDTPKNRLISLDTSGGHMFLNDLLPLRPLFRDVCRFAPAGVSLALVLMILTSLFTGVGILLIIPLIGAVGVDLGETVGAASSSIAGQVSGATAGLGLSLSLGGVLTLYVLLIAGVATLRYGQAVLSDKLRRSFVLEIRRDLYSKLMDAQWRYVNEQRQADFVRLVTVQVTSIGSAIHQSVQLLSQIVLVAVYLGLSVLLSPSLTALAVLCSFGLVAAMFPLNRRIHGSGQIGLHGSREIFSNVVEQISSIKVIKSFSAERPFLERVVRASALLEEQQVRMTRFVSLTRLVNLTSAALIFAVLFYVSIQWIRLPTSNIVLILFVFSRLMPQVSAIQSTVQSLIHMAPMYTDVLEHTAALAAHREPPADADANAAPEFQDSIELIQAGYRYLDKPEPVFAGVNLRIACNETVALVGPSGIGKSTLADIIAGLISPTMGEMRVDGRAIDDRNRRRWRSQVAYVTQDVLLFHDSIRENLSWASPAPPTEAELWDALRHAAAEGFVRSLPKGLDTTIGDRGVKLSGGERQRLALARALLSKPRLLILDEATSALDQANQRAIRDALVGLQGKLTMVIIAHDETTIAHVRHRLDLSALA